MEESEDLSYRDELNTYEELVSLLIKVSGSSGGIGTTTIGIEGTKIFTRLVLSVMTIGGVLPFNRINKSEHWDFPSIGILARALIETTHRYLYLIDSNISEEEANFRRKLHFYRSNCEKYRLYSEEENHVILKEFEEKLPESKAEIMSFQTYLSLDKNMAKKIRSGKSDMHFTDSEVAKKYGLIMNHFGFYYRLLSNQSHGSPFSTTSQSNERGRGMENDVERFYLCLVLRILNRYMSKTLLSQIELLSLQDKFPEMINRANIVLKSEQI